jgi:hypothetical protein
MIHQLAQASASIRREHVPGVAQVVKMDRWQASSPEGREPDPDAEVGMPQW